MKNKKNYKKKKTTPFYSKFYLEGDNLNFSKNCHLIFLMLKLIFTNCCNSKRIFLICKFKIFSNASYG